MSGERNIWGDLPANPRALRLSIEELDRAEGLCLHEIENEVDYLECVALVLHEVKRLRWRPIATAPMDGTHILVGRASAKPIRAWFENGRWWMHGAGPHSRNTADLTGPYAPTHWMPLLFAPCDGSGAAGETEGLDTKCNSAVDEAEAPDIVDELGDAASILRSNDAPYCATVVERAAKSLQALQAENARLTTALAESERKAALVTSAAAGIICVALTARRKNTNDWMAGLAEDINKVAAVVGSSDRFAYDGRDHIVRLPRPAAPTQETTHVEG